VSEQLALYFKERHLPDLTAIDLFCGAGGLSAGFRQAGYHVVAGNDLDEMAGRTFASTHKEAKFLPGPIQNYHVTDFLKVAGLKPGKLDVLIGGPPCQGFSVYNHQRGLHDQRSSLYKEYLRLVEGLMPKWIVLENVTGMTSAGGGAAVHEILRGLRQVGYAVANRILKAEEFGIPQERRRIVFVGNRIGAPIQWPSATHGPGLLPFVTVRDAIGDLPKLENGEDKGALPYACKAVSSYQKMLRGDLDVVTNHSAARLSAINLQRMKYIPQGGSWRDIPVDLLPAGMKRAKRSDHTKRYGRLRWEGLASTILTKCDPHWGAFFHPEQDRALTVREAARLQSFPDWFDFQGTRTEQYVQVGNAVPPLLGRRIAETIRETVEASRDLAFFSAAE
jgi:DNA (cytosine-5)-methyltransferase 1